MAYSGNPPSYNTAVQRGVYDDFYLDPSRSELRLLAVSPGSWQEGVKCTLYKSSLNINPKYHALSYTWGDASDRQTITLNGQPFSVTSNLATALHRIRGIGGHKWYWWIDALCINQEDASEKSHQIQMMRRIYSSCQEVLIYLGEILHDDSFTFKSPTDPKSTEATRPIVWHLDDRDNSMLDVYWNEFIRDGNEEFHHKSPGSFDKTFHIFCFFRLIFGNYHITDIPVLNTANGTENPYSKAMTSALYAFANVPWWTRAWCAQEVIFPPKATMVYGPVICPLNIWQKAFINFGRHRHTCCEGIHINQDVAYAMIACTHDLDDLLTSQDAFLKNDQSGWQRSIYRLCTQFASRSSTDDHDKVYAFLGLATDWFDMPPIYPDYSVSVPDLFTKVTLDVTLASQRLDSLINNLEKRNYPDLPSWVLDFTNNDIENVQDCPRKRMVAQYNTTPGNGTIRWHPPRMLCVTGFELDTIVGVTDCESFSQKLCKEFFLLAHLDSLPQRPYPRGGDYLNAYWRTLCSDCTAVSNENNNGTEPSIIENDYYRVVAGHYDVFVDWAFSRNLSPFYDGPDGDQNGLTNAQKESFKFIAGFRGRQFDYKPRHRASVGALYLAMKYGMQSRRCFITRNGLLGSGPRALRPGDRIWVLHGARVPFVLRRKTHGWSGDAWEAVGYTYVHGIMDGEACGEGRQDRELYLV